MNKIIETMKQNPLPLNYPKLPYILMETIRTAWNNEFVAEGDGLLSATNGVYCGQALKEVHFDNDNEKAVSIGLLYSLVPREYTGEWGVEAQMKVPVSINLQASLIFDIDTIRKAVFQRSKNRKSSPVTVPSPDYGLAEINTPTFAI